MYIFLQGWRAALIPMLAVPVSLIGTFAFFPLFGFSINTLSLFGLVLAIGLVVDDAIVVVEAVERHIEEGLSPKDAALKAMQEVAGPVVAIALILAAVFMPTVFIAGITGPALPAVRADHCHLRDPLGLQRALAQPRARRHALDAPKKPTPVRCADSSTGSIACSPDATNGYVALQRRAHPQERPQPRPALVVVAGVALMLGHTPADRLSAGGRPGLRST